ncbi:MAG: ArsR/SmtB family transcription factor, partial [Pseudonocardia sp.]
MTADQVSAEQPPGVGQPAGGGTDEEVGIVLVALADPTRRQLLNALVDAGRASATTLADRLPVSRQAVAKHLQVLESAGLVERVRVGREVPYSA